jgi:dienelactone hydrolase
MAKPPPPGINHPTLPYFAYRGPHKIATGDLRPAGMPGVVFAPTSGRRLPIVALGHGWLQSVDRYADTMRHLASWGIIVVAPNTHRWLFSSNQGLALDLSRSLRLVAHGRLGGGLVRGDLRRMGVLGHSTGGGAAILAAAKDRGIKAVVTVAAAETSPSAVAAAGLVEVPSLHLVGDDDTVSEDEGVKIARSCTGPAQLRKVKGAGHMGLVEGRDWTNTLVGQGSDKDMVFVTRMLATAFFIRHLTNAEQLADQLEKKVKGTKPEKLEPEEPETHAIDLEQLSEAIADI